MKRIESLSVCARVTMNLHNLNSEGTEGNQQQTRMVHVIDEKGRRAMVNAVSGDMFKHILVEHLIPLLESENEPLSAGAKLHDADRINAVNPAFNAFCDDDKNLDSAVLSRLLSECSLTDIAGALITRGRAVARKSIAEFGWVVGIPQDGDGNPVTTTEQYFHVKYAPEGRGASAGGETVAGTQAIFHRPASSGVYALICNLDLHRIGFNDITREYVVQEASRKTRARATIHALAATLVKPAGAQRNTQNPHIVACEGVIAKSRSSLPAPTVSPLTSYYKDEVGKLKTTLNKIHESAIEVAEFSSLSEAAERLREVADEFK